MLTGWEWDDLEIASSDLELEELLASGLEVDQLIAVGVLKDEDAVEGVRHGGDEHRPNRSEDGLDVTGVDCRGEPASDESGRT